MNIFIDIETLPTESNQQIDYVVSKIKAPGNYKDTEKIQAFIDSKRDETIAKTALSGLFGRVYMIGYAIENNPVNVIYEPTEHETLEVFNTLLGRNNYGDNKCTFIGHNISEFDIPFLSQRLMINGFMPLFRHGAKPWAQSVDDTMRMFACGKFKQYYSLEELCLAFDIESPKQGMDGSQVAGMYAKGEHERVKEYCAADVTATRQLYYRLTKPKAA